MPAFFRKTPFLVHFGILQSIATSAYRPTPPFLWLLEPSWPKIEGVQNTCTRAHSTEYLHKGLDFPPAAK
jgi:hypothetical protein